jgi:hypothetical protein
LLPDGELSGFTELIYQMIHLLIWFPRPGLRQLCFWKFEYFHQNYGQGVQVIKLPSIKFSPASWSFIWLGSLIRYFMSKWRRAGKSYTALPYIHRYSPHTQTSAQKNVLRWSTHTCTHTRIFLMSPQLLFILHWLHIQLQRIKNYCCKIRKYKYTV